MERIRLAPRPDWRARVEEVGLDWHTADDGGVYWDESACWRLSPAEVDRIETAVGELWDMVLAAVEDVISRGRLADFGYAGDAAELIERSWRLREAEPALYARFDLAYDGRDLKMLELNGDTPTSLLEAAAVQWWWMEQRFPLADQFNGVHDALIGALKAWRRGAPSNVLHFTCVTPHAEDEGTVTYLAACAGEAGLTPVFVPLEEIGLTDDGFVDGQDRPIEAMFKLVPWEWMLADPFGERLAAEVLAGRLRLVEPAWKMLASHKRLLVTLKAMFPDSPLLLDATDDVAVARGWGDYVRKPVHGREGANVALYTGGQKDASQDGTFEDDEVIYQRRAALAQADGAYAVLGGWIVDGEACGLGIRESRGPITTNTARFVPHVMAEPGEVGG